MNLPILFRRSDEVTPYSLLRRTTEFEFEDLDVLRPPLRFWSDADAAPRAALLHEDARQLRDLRTPAEQLNVVPVDNWMATTRRSLGKLRAWFLVGEDPQRRLESQGVSMLAHQASLVRHIATSPELLRVVLADEVGLGKTVEAGMLIKHVLEGTPSARILYLAPARLVRNVRQELRRLGLRFRSWVATPDHDGTLDDNLIVASIHRAAHKNWLEQFLSERRWDMIVVDECHHLSDWAMGGGKPTSQYRLVHALSQQMTENGRLLLMSGTPHQGSQARFQNILRLIKRPNEDDRAVAGRVIYRTKESVRDWDGKPLFPLRTVNQPLVVDLGPTYQRWLADILDFFNPSEDGDSNSAKRRAAGWRSGQALQWAASSVQAGLGYLIRQAVRAGQSPSTLEGLARALAAIRPYRGGTVDENIEALWSRISKEVRVQEDSGDVEDIEEYQVGSGWKPNLDSLNLLLDQGVALLREVGDAKWESVWRHLLEPAGQEKVVLFAQPIETVTAVASFLERTTGRRPAIIVGGQTEEVRSEQQQAFWDPNGPQFLVSSRAGGEGFNLQVARRLVHLDVPWNPMDMEQRVGRVHRFLSRKTIIVDTVVAKDSREVDMYSYAREKLRAIATSMGIEADFESLFGRVMSLVPPESLQEVLTESPMGPLDDAAKLLVGRLVAEGAREWKAFHDRYAEQQSRITALNPGLATWDDLARFAREELGAVAIGGFSALRFEWSQGEVVEQSADAEVLRIGSELYASGDHGGMPVTGGQGQAVEKLGTNVNVISQKLRELAFGDAAGAAHLRWNESEIRPAPGPFGVLVMVRHSVRHEHVGYADVRLSLRCWVVTASDRRELEGEEKAQVIRGLLASTVRRDPEQAQNLVDAMISTENALADELRRPTEEERRERVVNVVWPVFAGIVG